MACAAADTREMPAWSEEWAPLEAFFDARPWAQVCRCIDFKASQIGLDPYEWAIVGPNPDDTDFDGENIDWASIPEENPFTLAVELMTEWKSRLNTILNETLLEDCKTWYWQDKDELLTDLGAISVSNWREDWQAIHEAIREILDAMTTQAFDGWTSATLSLNLSEDVFVVSRTMKKYQIEGASIGGGYLSMSSRCDYNKFPGPSINWPNPCDDTITEMPFRLWSDFDDGEPPGDSMFVSHNFPCYTGSGGDFLNPAFMYRDGPTPTREGLHLGSEWECGDPVHAESGLFFWPEDTDTHYVEGFGWFCVTEIVLSIRASLPVLAPLTWEGGPLTVDWALNEIDSNGSISYSASPGMSGTITVPSGVEYVDQLVTITMTASGLDGKAPFEFDEVDGSGRSVIASVNSEHFVRWGVTGSNGDHPACIDDCGNYHKA